MARASRIPKTLDGFKLVAERAMGIEAILFDLDGTLLDRRATFRHHLEAQVARHPGLFDDADAQSYIARLLRLDENGTVDRTEFYERSEATLGLAPGSATTLADDFERHFPETCVPMPNARECLMALQDRGIRLGLVTNGRELIQSRKIDRLGIASLLDAIVISETLGVRKPDPRIFTEAVSKVGATSASTAFVGDDPESDVRGAARAGLTAIWRRDVFWPEPPEASLVIDDLKEILTWLDGGFRASVRQTN